MLRFRHIMQKILFPNIWIVLLSVPAAAAGLIYVFAGGRQDDWISYPLYAFSAFSLTWVCARLFRDIGHAKEIWQSVLERVPVLKRYLTDAAFNTSVSLYLSLALNVLYSAVKLYFGIHYRSVWFGTLAVYYFLLAVIYFALLHHAVRNPFGAELLSEWKRYRLCGILLLIMNLALTGMVILVVLKDEGFNYAGYLIYIMALYAFYSITFAVKNVVKYRRYHSPVMSAAKVLRLAAALVSMLALETAMLAQFGAADDQLSRKIMTACTGCGVCAIILGVAVYMICHATKMIQTLKTEEIS